VPQSKIDQLSNVASHIFVHLLTATVYMHCTALGAYMRTLAVYIHTKQIIQTINNKAKRVALYAGTVVS
jgi:hypothetical protein